MRIKKARKVIRKAFEKDGELLVGYVSNIAMLLHDKGGITDYEKRNRLAKDILLLLFWQED